MQRPIHRALKALLGLVFSWKAIGSHGRPVSRGIPTSLKFSLALDKDWGRQSLKPALSFSELAHGRACWNPSSTVS